MNTFYLSFGSVKVGERFRFVNPYIPADAQDWTYRKVSPRKYRCECGPNAGRDYQTGGRVAVAIVYLDMMVPFRWKWC